MKRPDPSVPRVGRVEFGDVFRRGFRLVLVLILVVGHAVDDLAGIVLGHLDALLFGRRAVPFGKAVAAEAG